MRTVEYRVWCPDASPIRVEFTDQLMLGLGIVETSGILNGSRHGRIIRILGQGARAEDEEQEKVGVFVSRIRGEVFLTETDLAFFNEQEGLVALVVAGDRAGFFVREADGSIQTVRSHEEFSIAPPPVAVAEPKKLLPAPKWIEGWKWAPAGMVMLAALAVFPQHPTKRPSTLEVHENGGQLRISWKPGQNVVLAIEDGGSRSVIPVSSNQSNITYAPRGSEVAVTLISVDAANETRSESALYISSIAR